MSAPGPEEEELGGVIVARHAHHLGQTESVCVCVCEREREREREREKKIEGGREREGEEK